MHRRRVHVLGTALALGTLAFVMLLPVLARTPEVDTQARSTTAAPLDLTELDRIRSLPLLPAQGVVRSEFANGKGLDDYDRVRAATLALGRTAGIEDAVRAMWTALPGAVEPGNDTPQRYPYSYDALQPLADALTDPVVQDHADALRELVGLLALAAARGTPGDLQTYPNSDAERLTKASVGAQVIAARLGRTGHCDDVLTEAWLLGLSDNPVPADYTKVFKAAIAACPDDPTPRWLLGQRLIEDAVNPYGLMDSNDTGDVPRQSETMAAPFAYFDQWLAEQPKSVLAHIGRADAYLRQAEFVDGRMPFTARADARDALAGYEEIFTDTTAPPVVTLAEARALAVLRDDEAGARAKRAVAAAPDSPAIRAWQGNLQERSGHYADAAAAYAQASPPSDRLTLVYAFGPSLPPAWFGSEHARTGMLADTRTPAWSEAGTVDWLGFLPDFREVPALDSPPDCTAQPLTRNLILAGKYDEARAAAAKSCADNFGALETLGEVAAYLANPTKSPGDDAALDEAQNLLRYAGDYEGAESLLQGATSRRLLQRLGEVRFVRENYAGAIAAFEQADGACCTEDDEQLASVTEFARHLMLGLAQEKDGDLDEALATYQAARDAFTPSEFELWWDGPSQDALMTSAESRIGAVLMAEGRVEDAIPHLRAAAQMAAEHDGDLTQNHLTQNFTPTSGAEYNNLAVALLAEGEKSDEAVTLARQALILDPRSPVYLDTLAQALEAAGQTAEAWTQYKAAVAEDPTVYQAQNNLGVAQAKAGDRSEAIASLKAAISAQPDYALAWFNLGTVLARSSNPRDFFESQGALAKAVRLDHTFRGAAPELTSDRTALQSGLDISRPIDADWKFADSASRPQRGLTLVIVILALFRLLYVLGSDRLGEEITNRVLTSSSHPHARWARVWASVNRYVALPVALATTALIGAWPIVQTVGLNWFGVALAIAVGAALGWLYTALSQDSRSTKAIPRRGWLPAMAVGAAASAVGYTFVPVPTEASEHTAGLRRWAGAGLLGAVAAVCLVASFWTGTPFVRSVTLSALAMVAVALLPMRPFDGVYLTKRSVSFAVSVALLVVSTGLTLAVI